MDRIRDYIATCRKEGVSFDIFDEKRPFMQATPNPKYDQDKNLKSPAVLDSTRASGNNLILFDHTLEDNVVLTPAEALISILATQVFCPSDGQGYFPCINYRKGQGQPLYFLPKGKNLFETLVLAMFTISKDSHEREVWRNEMEIIPKAEIIAVLPKIYGMMFPSRRIRLIADEGVVKQVFFQPGLHLVSDWTDPHVAYYRDKDKIWQIRPSMEKEGWRNIGTLAIQFTNNEATVPAVLRDYEKILQEQNQTTMEIVTFGVIITGNAKYDDMQKGTFTLDIRIAENERKAFVIAESVSWMDGVGLKLQDHLKEMIAPTKRGENDVQNLVHRFYAQCEPIFYVLSDKVASCDEDDLKETADGWTEDVKRLAQRIFSDAQEIYCSTADELIRAEKAYKWLNVDIAKLMKGR